MKVFRSPSARYGAIPSKSQTGLSLIELMVSLTLSLILTAGVIKIFTSSKVIFSTQEGISQIQENQRIAMNRIIRDVSSAGYMGCLESSTADIQSTLDYDQDIYNYTIAVSGEEGGDATTPDTLIIRRASEGAAIPLTEPMDSQTDITLKVDPNHPNFRNFKQWDVAILSDCGNAVAFLITNDPNPENDPASLGIIQHAIDAEVPQGLKNAGRSNTQLDFNHVYGCQRCSIAKIYSVGSTRYYIDSSNSGEGNSLFVDTGRAQELIQGVSNFQVWYGIDTALNNGVATASQYVTANNVADWKQVVSVKVRLILDAASDPDLNKEFEATIRLRNQEPS